MRFLVEELPEEERALRVQQINLTPRALLRERDSDGDVSVVLLVLILDQGHPRASGSTMQLLRVGNGFVRGVREVVWLC